MAQVCPFCGSPETDRIALEGQTFLVFRCLFTPKVDPSLDEVALAVHLKEVYATGGSTYFRGMCDTLHLYVTKGQGARELRATGPTPP